MVPRHVLVLFSSHLSAAEQAAEVSDLGCLILAATAQESRRRSAVCGGAILTFSTLGVSCFCLEVATQFSRLPTDLG